EELAILPGMEEVSILLYLNQYVKEKTYDVILLDCAPTGESLRFISLPTTLEWYMRRVFHLERSIARIARPLVANISPVPLPDAWFDGWRAVQERYVRAAEETFAPLPSFHVPLQSGEVLGLEGLRRMGQQIYGDADPAKVFSTTRPYRFEKKNGAYRLVMTLP